MNVGNRIRKTIKDQGRSIKWVAQRAEMNDFTLRRICRGETDPSTDQLISVALVLGVSADFLLGLKDEQAS